jgi:general stress protein CsbA
MKSFIILGIALASILIAVSLLLDNLMGIFIVSILVCIFLEGFRMEKQNHKRLDDK